MLEVYRCILEQRTAPSSGLKSRKKAPAGRMTLLLACLAYLLALKMEAVHARLHAVISLKIILLLDSSCSGYGPLVGCCKNGNELR
jgi:hypothetical protein